MHRVPEKPAGLTSIGNRLSGAIPRLEKVGREGGSEGEELRKEQSSLLGYLFMAPKTLVEDSGYDLRK